MVVYVANEREEKRMRAKERFYNFINGKAVDRRLNFNIFMEFASNFAGYTMDTFCKDYKVLVDANIKAAREFEVDLVGVMSDPYCETADYGANIVFPFNKLPHCSEPFIKTYEDVKKLKPIIPENSVRMYNRVEAIKKYKEEVGDEFPILGWCEGMAAETSDLMGLSNMIVALYDEPEMMKEIMDICFESAINCIKAQVEAGADIIGIGDAASSVMGPILYKEWVLSYEQKLFAEIKNLGAIGRLHICGDITPLLDDIRKCGANIVDIDWMVDFKLTREKLSDKMIICGNFDPVSVLLQGDIETVKRAVRKCIDDGGENAIIMAGCEVPVSTPHANIKAVSEVLWEEKSV